MVGDSSKEREDEERERSPCLTIKVRGSGNVFVSVDQHSNLADLRKYMDERFIMNVSNYQFANVERNVLINMSMESKTRIKNVASFTRKRHHTFHDIYLVEATIDVVINDESNQRNTIQDNLILSCRDKSCVVHHHEKSNVVSKLEMDFNNLSTRQQKYLILQHLTSSLA